MHLNLSCTLTGTLVFLAGATACYAQKNEGGNAAETKHAVDDASGRRDGTRYLFRLDAAKADRANKDIEAAIQDLGFKRAPKPGAAVTHCRVIPTPLGFNVVWWVRQAATQDEFLSRAGYDFEIFDSGHWPATAVSIDIDDRIQNTAAGSSIKLDHSRPRRPPTTPITLDPVASSSTMLQRHGGIWLQGASASAIGSEKGTYYVFLLEDAKTCTHTTYTAPCRRIHVEYFEDGLTTDRPALGVNVFDIHDRRCTEGLWQTDDGDGDEGLR